MRIVVLLLFLLLVFSCQDKEKYFIRVDCKTTYAEVYDEYVRLRDEKGNDCNILIKKPGLPPFALHASVLCSTQHRFCLYLRKDYTAICWLDYDDDEPLAYDGWYEPEKIIEAIRKVSRKKNFPVDDAIEFVVYPECFSMTIEQHIELLQKLSELFRNRITYVHIKSYPRKL